MSLHNYSTFMLKDLHLYIETSHCLVVQADGYVTNPERWNPGWLAYDYIGAPWPPNMGAGKVIIPLKNRVGNGGFSLRSRKLLKAVAPIHLGTMRYPTHAEDMIISHLLYDYLVAQGIRFADMETAARFAIEHPDVTLGQTLETVFGFHGRFLLPEVKAREAASMAGRS